MGIYSVYSDDTGFRYLTFLRVIDKIYDYNAYVSFDDEVYNIITGEELEYICNVDTSQRDIDEYYGLR